MIIFGVFVYVNLILLGGLSLFHSKLCDQILPYTLMFMILAIPLIFIDIRKMEED